MMNKNAGAVLLLGLLLAGCGGGVVTPGGQYSGVPDTYMGDHKGNMPTGTISTGGTMWTRQGGYMTTPTGR